MTGAPKPARCWYCGKPSVAIELRTKPRRQERPVCEEHGKPWLQELRSGAHQYRDLTGLSPCCGKPTVELKGAKVFKFQCPVCFTRWSDPLGGILPP